MKFSELCWAAFSYYMLNMLTWKPNEADKIYIDSLKQVQKELEADSPIFSKISESIIEFLNAWGIRIPYYLKGEVQEKLREKLEKLKSDFDSLKGQDLEKYNFNQKEPIITMFKDLDNIPQISSTAVSKIMHLMNPKLFVMWDHKILNAYCNKYRWYGYVSDIYLPFLKKMQEEAKEVIQDFQEQRLEGEPADFISQKLDYHPPKTLAKFIDEYNYIKYTKGFSIPPKEHLLDFLRFLLKIS